MLIHNNSSVFIAFGDAYSSFIPDQHKNIASTAVIHHAPFRISQKYIQLKSLVFLHEAHTDYGVVIHDQARLETLPTFTYVGDYSITHLPAVGLAVTTADCLPILLYDHTIPAVAAIHAGWRGSLQAIARKGVDSFCKHYATKPDTIAVFFGPSAGGCCYQIGNDLLSQLQTTNWYNVVIKQRNGSYFFDLPLFNYLELVSAGVPPNNIHTMYNACTIENNAYCSYRRDRNQLRQFTIVALKQPF